MASETSVCNMALSHIAVGTAIANLQERSKEARACAEFYEQTRDEVLEAAPWPFATAFANLALVQENPIDEWRFSYRYPTDCVTLRRITPGVGRMYANTYKIPYRIGRDNQGKLVYTDQENARIEYTLRITDTTEFPADVRQAISLKLAHYIAPQITKGDDFKLANRALQLHEWIIGQARARAFNEEQRDAPIDSEFIRVR